MLNDVGRPSLQFVAHNQRIEEILLTFDVLDCKHANLGNRHGDVDFAQSTNSHARLVFRFLPTPQARGVFWAAARG